MPQRRLLGTPPRNIGSPKSADLVARSHDRVRRYCWKTFSITWNKSLVVKLVVCNLPSVRLMLLASPDRWFFRKGTHMRYAVHYRKYRWFVYRVRVGAALDLRTPTGGITSY